MSGRILWYPAPSVFRVSDIGRVFTSIQRAEHRSQSVIDSAAGCRTVLTYAGYSHVDISAELQDSVAAAREQEAIINWVSGHRPIAVAENDDCFIGGQVTPVEPLAEELQLLTLPWSNWGNGDFTAGSVFVLKSPGPNYFREEVVATAWDGVTLSLDAPTIFDYSNEPFVWCHQLEFHPFLRLREGAKPTLIHDKRITWALSLPMEEIPISLSAITGAPYAGS